MASGERRVARDGWRATISPGADGLVELLKVDLDSGESAAAWPPPGRRTQVFTLWLRSGEPDRRRKAAAELIHRLLDDNPHSTLQVLIEPTAAPYRLSLETLEVLQAACFQSTSYLDLYYSLHPNRLLGAKRLVVLLPEEARQRIGLDWIQQAGDYASLAWLGGRLREDSLESHEHVVPLPGRTEGAFDDG